MDLEELRFETILVAGRKLGLSKCYTEKSIRQNTKQALLGIDLKYFLFEYKRQKYSYTIIVKKIIKLIISHKNVLRIKTLLTKKITKH